MNRIKAENKMTGFEVFRRGVDACQDFHQSKFVPVSKQVFCWSLIGLVAWAGVKIYPHLLSFPQAAQQICAMERPVLTPVTTPVLKHVKPFVYKLYKGERTIIEQLEAPMYIEAPMYTIR